MSYTCGICGGPGHNARSCPKGKKGAKAATTKPTPARRPAPVVRAIAEAAKESPAVAEGAVSVLEALYSRRDQLRRELEGVDRKRRELELVESTINDLEEIGASS